MKIVVLCGSGQSTNILVNYLLALPRVSNVCVIMENAPSKKSMIKHRIRKLGLFETMGQLAFMALAQPLIKKSAQARIDDVVRENGLQLSPPPEDTVIRVNSINDSHVAEEIAKFSPDVAFVNGTRIIRKHIFESYDCKFINIHAGITPLYRGVHGGYWCIWNKDSENFGSTLHYIDAGVDTGQPLAYCRTMPKAEDNYASYPFLQQAVALRHISGILDAIAQGDHPPDVARGEMASRQWYHPTLWGYLFARLRGVK